MSVVPPTVNQIGHGNPDSKLNEHPDLPPATGFFRSATGVDARAHATGSIGFRCAEPAVDQTSNRRNVGNLIRKLLSQSPLPSTGMSNFRDCLLN